VTSYAKNAKLPGFRPGKAPRAVVERKFAADIDSRSIEELGSISMREMSKQEGLEIISVDTADNKALDNGTSFTFTVTLRPAVALPDYKGLKIEVQQLQITDEFITKIIDRQREQFATMKEVTDRPAQMGDFCVVDYTGEIDGTPMKDLVKESQSFLAENTGFLLKLNEENFLPGFTEQLVGVNAGETKSVTATLPAETSEAIAGKSATYQVKVSAIKEQELPEVNDEFAARLLPGKTLEELRAFVKERVQADAANSEFNQKRANVLTALSGETQFELPESLVQQAAQRRINELVNTNLRQGISQEILKENEEAIVGAASQQAEVDVRQEFMLLEIAKAEKIAVTNEEMGQQISYMAAQQKISGKNMVKELEKRDQMQSIRVGILLEKTVKFLIDNAEISYKSVTPEEAEQQQKELEEASA
jgi:trigger factor